MGEYLTPIKKFLHHDTKHVSHFGQQLLTSESKQYSVRHRYDNYENKTRVNKYSTYKDLIKKYSKKIWCNLKAMSSKTLTLKKLKSVSQSKTYTMSIWTPSFLKKSGTSSKIVDPRSSVLDNLFSKKVDNNSLFANTITYFSYIKNNVL